MKFFKIVGVILFGCFFIFVVKWIFFLGDKFKCVSWLVNLMFVIIIFELLFSFFVRGMLEII